MNVWSVVSRMKLPIQLADISRDPKEKQQLQRLWEPDSYSARWYVIKVSTNSSTDKLTNIDYTLEEADNLIGQLCGDRADNVRKSRYQMLK